MGILPVKHESISWSVTHSHTPNKTQLHENMIAINWNILVILILIWFLSPIDSRFEYIVM